MLLLIVCVDDFINEYTVLADFIVPDTLSYESWGTSAPWADVIAKTSTLRWPVVEPKVDRTQSGEPISIEMFFIEVAKRLGMPGIGEDAISDHHSDKRYPIHNAQDIYLRGFAIVAYAMGRPVPAAS